MTTYEAWAEVVLDSLRETWGMTKRDKIKVLAEVLECNMGVFCGDCEHNKEKDPPTWMEDALSR